MQPPETIQHRDQKEKIMRASKFVMASVAGVAGVGIPALKSQSTAFATPPPANIQAFVDATKGARANRQNVEIGKTGVPLGVRDGVAVAGRGREIGEVFSGRKSAEDAMRTLAVEMNKALEETKA